VKSVLNWSCSGNKSRILLLMQYCLYLCKQPVFVLTKLFKSCSLVAIGMSFWRMSSKRMYLDRIACDHLHLRFVILVTDTWHIKCSVLYRPRSEGWPHTHHGRTFSIYLSPLSFWLTLPWEVLFMSRCCPPRPCVVFLACVQLALFLALSLSPGNSLVSSWCDDSMLASLLWRCLTLLSFLRLC